MNEDGENKPVTLDDLVASLPDEIQLLDENDNPIEDALIELDYNTKKTLVMLMLDTGDSLEKVIIDTLMYAAEKYGDEEE